jgi:tRNA wybutosine-synthesizing protein 1
MVCLCVRGSGAVAGEPIIYPRVNELIGALHRRRISTFMVTNAQFPGAIASLVPVTQVRGLGLSDGL